MVFATSITGSSVTRGGGGGGARDDGVPSGGGAGGSGGSVVKVEVEQLMELMEQPILAVVEVDQEIRCRVVEVDQV